MTTLELLSAEALRRTMVTFRDAVRAHAPRINRLNVYPVPDGDTGTNMARTLDAVVAALDEAGPDLAATCAAISHGSLMGARGNSGVILSQLLRGLTATVRDAARPAGATAAVVAAALRDAAAAARSAVLTPVEGTILTVAHDAAEGAVTAAAADAELADVLRAARNAGAASLERTPELLPVLRDAGVVDAGGAGFLLLLDAALHVVAAVPLPEPDPADGSGPDAAPPAASPAPTAEAMRYEVMFFLDLDDASIDGLKSSWAGIGDSIVVVGGDGLWNCHVHTGDIGAAIEAALDLGGRPRGIRVTDLVEEVAEEHARREAAMHVADAAPVACGVVAVASGDGLGGLFRDLGVHQVVLGGQTLNPSTAELLEALERVPADQVVVLPNNKNIIPVAEQLAALTSKRVAVVPTRSMPEALAALVVYDPEAPADVNAAEMAEAAASVGTGEVTRAVRAAAGPSGPIAEGDWIGLVRGDGIVAAGSSVTAVTTDLLGRLVADGGEIVSIITGADARGDDVDAVVAWLADEHPDVQVEVHRGGQPLYPFLLGVE